MTRTPLKEGLGKAIDNSHVVRERDPRSSRDIFLLLVMVAALVGGMVLYAWPHFERRQLDAQRQTLQGEKERLLEQNRKLRLEKASLEDLRRVESIATRELGLTSPAAEDVIVVEPARPLPDGALVARRHEVEEAPPQ